MIDYDCANCGVTIHIYAKYCFECSLILMEEHDDEQADRCREEDYDDIEEE